MKKNSVIPTPCPKCGSNFLAHGKPYGCTTPRILAWLGSLHGVICVSCGHYAPTVIAWNGDWEKKKGVVKVFGRLPPGWHLPLWPLPAS